MKFKSLVTPLLFIVAGLVLIIFSKSIDTVIPYVVAIVLALSGITAIVSYLTKDPYEQFEKGGLAVGLTAIAVASYIFAKPDTVQAILPAVCSFAVIVSGLWKLEATIGLQRTGFKNWLVVLCLALVCVAYGIVLLLLKDIGNVWLGIGFVISGATDLASLLLFGKQKKKAKVPAE